MLFSKICDIILSDEVVNKMDITGIDLLGIDRVIKRGTAKILERAENALLVYDTVSGAYMLACDDTETGIAVLDENIDKNCRLLMTSDIETGKIAYEKYDFDVKLECYQVAYYGNMPEPDEKITFRPAGHDDLPILISTYDLISPDEMETVVKRKSMLLGFDNGKLIGFIGEHLEGSMGLLYVFPEFRNCGYASSLEKALITYTMQNGFIPFGQVEKDNVASLLLQKKLGMTQSENLICWMWKE